VHREGRKNYMDRQDKQDSEGNINRIDLKDRKEKEHRTGWGPGWKTVNR
jgi:hypothetical protein